MSNLSNREAWYEGFGTGDLKIELQKADAQIATLQQRIVELENKGRQLLSSMNVDEAATKHVLSQWDEFLSQYDQIKTESSKT